MKLTYEHKRETLKRRVSIPYYIDYANSDATPLIGHYPNCRQIVWCYTKKQMLEKALNKEE